MTEISKITVKGQTTVPRQIREAIKISAGDLISWEVDDDGSIRVRRVEPLDVAYLRALDETLSEWSSENDEEAYRDL
jgi:antitoxin PrlF